MKHNSRDSVTMNKNTKMNNTAFTWTDFPLLSVINVPALQAFATSDWWLSTSDIKSEGLDRINEFATKGGMLTSQTFRDWTSETSTSAGDSCVTVDMSVTFVAVGLQSCNELFSSRQLPAEFPATSTDESSETVHVEWTVSLTVLLLFNGPYSSSRILPRSFKTSSWNNAVTNCKTRSQQQAGEQLCQSTHMQTHGRMVKLKT